MAYDEALADRVRGALLRRKGVTEKKMFGGVCFMVNGHMCCGVASKDLVLRLGEEGTAAALEEPHTRPFGMTGKPMKTMLFVSPAGHRGDEALKAWLDQAVDFARSLPPQKPKRQGRKNR
jgi:TfoX/Sxy family transcriptional regulator of competence genes